MKSSPLTTTCLFPSVHKDTLQGTLCLGSYLFSSMCILTKQHLVQTISYEVQSVLVSSAGQLVFDRIWIFYWNTGLICIRSTLVPALEHDRPRAHSNHWRWIYMAQREVTWLTQAASIVLQTPLASPPTGHLKTLKEPVLLMYTYKLSTSFLFYIAL